MDRQMRRMVQDELDFLVEFREDICSDIQELEIELRLAEATRSQWNVDGVETDLKDAREDLAKTVAEIEHLEGCLSIPDAERRNRQRGFQGVGANQSQFAA